MVELCCGQLKDPLHPPSARPQPPPPPRKELLIPPPPPHLPPPLTHIHTRTHKHSHTLHLPLCPSLSPSNFKLNSAQTHPSFHLVTPFFPSSFVISLPPLSPRRPVKT
ncbi:uncharacterized, partial [Lates japonicus]